jgi:hypothetical protein
MSVYAIGLSFATRLAINITVEAVNNVAEMVIGKKNVETAIDVVSNTIEYSDSTDEKKRELEQININRLGDWIVQDINIMVKFTTYFVILFFCITKIVDIEPYVRGYVDFTIMYEYIVAIFDFGEKPFEMMYSIITFAIHVEKDYFDTVIYFTTFMSNLKYITIYMTFACSFLFIHYMFYLLKWYHVNKSNNVEIPILLHCFVGFIVVPIWTLFKVIKNTIGFSTLYIVVSYCFFSDYSIKTSMNNLTNLFAIGQDFKKVFPDIVIFILGDTKGVRIAFGLTYIFMVISKIPTPAKKILDQLKTNYPCIPIIIGACIYFLCVCTNTPIMFISLFTFGKYLNWNILASIFLKNIFFPLWSFSFCPLCFYKTKEKCTIIIFALLLFLNGHFNVNRLNQLIIWFEQPNATNIFTQILYTKDTNEYKYVHKMLDVSISLIDTIHMLENAFDIPKRLHFFWLMIRWFDDKIQTNFLVYMGYDTQMKNIKEISTKLSNVKSLMNQFETAARNVKIVSWVPTICSGLYKHFF